MNAWIFELHRADRIIYEGTELREPKSLVQGYSDSALTKLGLEPRPLGPRACAVHWATCILQQTPIG